MTSATLMAQVLGHIPEEPVRMRYLITKTGRSDSNLRHILIDLLNLGLVERTETTTKKGNKKIVYWRKTKRV